MSMGIDQGGVTIRPDSRRVLAALGRLEAAGRDPSPALKAIGEDMRASTIERFMRAVDPSNTGWAPLNPEYARRKRGPGILRETRQLSQSIVWQLAAETLAVGTNRPHARVHQFGFRREGRLTIPARPFLGTSGADRRAIIETVTDYLVTASGGAVAPEF